MRDDTILLDHLADADRTIALGVRHIARQRAIIARLERAGHDTGSSRALLETFLRTQTLHENIGT